MEEKREGRGQGAEFLAAQFYLDRGYSIIARNYATRLGEIDLIVWGQGILAFVEVKFRSIGKLGIQTPEEAVTISKRRRIILAAREYLATKGRRFAQGPCRFDVLAIREERGLISFQLIEDAFQVE